MPSNGWISTLSPGFTSLLSIGNTIKQFASDIERRIPEPWGPVFLTVRLLFLSFSKIPRWYSTRPGFFLNEEVDIEIKNHSSADIILENHSNYTFENNADIFTIKGLNSIILKTKVGKRKIEDHLNFKVLNGIIAPKEYLKIKLATGI